MLAKTLRDFEPNHDTSFAVSVVSLEAENPTDHEGMLTSLFVQLITKGVADSDRRLKSDVRRESEFQCFEMPPGLENNPALAS